MRPFWITTQADGRVSPAATGPRESAGGSATTNFYAEVDGQSLRVLQVTCCSYRGRKRVKIEIGDDISLMWREEHRDGGLQALLLDVPLACTARKIATEFLAELIRDIAEHHHMLPLDIAEDVIKRLSEEGK